MSSILVREESGLYHAFVRPAFVTPAITRLSVRIGKLESQIEIPIGGVGCLYSRALERARRTLATARQALRDAQREAMLTARWTRRANGRADRETIRAIVNSVLNGYLSHWGHDPIADRATFRVDVADLRHSVRINRFYSYGPRNGIWPGSNVVWPGFGRVFDYNHGTWRTKPRVFRMAT